MQYANLHDLIQNSASSRQFFLSLPVSMQCKLHEHNTSIHTAAQLHTKAAAIESYDHLAKLGGWE